MLVITTKGIFLKCHHSVPQTLQEGEMHYRNSSTSLYWEQSLLNMICLLLHNWKEKVPGFIKQLNPTFTPCYIFNWQEQILQLHKQHAPACNR